MRLTGQGEIPPDNPFVHQAGARPEIWSYGIRNPQGWPSIPGAARYGCMNTVRAAAMKLTSRKKAKLWLAAGHMGRQL